MESVLNRVLAEISPSQSEIERLRLVSLRVREGLNKSLVHLGVQADIILGGSFARGTFLKGAHDFDFFIRFNRESELNFFNEVVLNAFPDAQEVRGSRTYFRTVIDGVEVEFIPVVRLDNPLSASNSMDASFFHVDYINARLNDSLRDEVRLLKQFCKSCGVYGAESHISGFSGYVIELIILRFGSFRAFVEFVNQGVDGLFIDLESYYDSPSKALTALRVNESINPVVIVDPVLPTRNAAAGLSKDSFDKFVLNARLFLFKPKKSFFRVVDLSISDFRELASSRGHSFFSYDFTVGPKSDVFFAKLGRELRKVRDSLEREGFGVFDFGYLSDGTVFFELVRDVLPVSKRVVGPPVSVSPDNFKSFIDKRDVINGPYVVDGRVCFDVERERTRAKPFLISLLKKIDL